MKTLNQTEGFRTSIPDAVAKVILQAVEGIDYGAVEIVIHEGRVVQIESRRKRRFDDRGPTS